MIPAQSPRSPSSKQDARPPIRRPGKPRTNGRTANRRQAAPVDPPTQIMNGASTASDWRRICLERQLPAARFPAGASVPMLVCVLCLVLLAALTAGYLRGPVDRRVSGAVADSQRDLVTTVAHSMRVAGDRARTDLHQAANRYADDPTHNAASLLAGMSVGGAARWRGVAVVSPGVQPPFAARGEPLDTTRAPVTAKRGVTAFVGADTYPRILVTEPLADGRVLAGVAVLVIRPLHLNVAARQSLLVALESGPVTHSQGTAGLEKDGIVAPLIKRAMRTGHGRHETQVRGPVMASQPAASMSTAYTVPLVTATPVPSLGVSVLSAVDAPTTGAGSPWRGLPAAVLLLALTLLISGMLRLALVRPVLRLLGQAKEISCGERPKSIRLSRVREVARIKRALDESTAPIRGKAATPVKRWTIPAVLPAVVASIAVIAWSAMVMIGLDADERTVPRQVTADSQNQVEGTAAAMRDVFDDGVTRLTAVAATAATGGDAGLRSALDDLTRQSRFRSAYLVGTNGEIRSRAGAEPLRGASALTGTGVSLDDSTGRVPALYAHTDLPDGRSLVVEYNIKYLAAVLRRAHGHLRLVDARMRTVVDTDGYVAFQPVSGTAVRRSAAGALGGRSTADVVTVHGFPALVSSAPLAGDARVVKLAVVAERKISDFRLAGNEQRRRAWLVAFIGVCVALLLFGWQFFLVVRPLRMVAAAADRLRHGDTEHVISPLRHDEIGAVAVCLEICRQARRYGADRLAGAVRLRGEGRDYTLVLPRIPTQRHAAPGPRHETSTARPSGGRRGSG